MPARLLEGISVVDLAGESAAMTGRILADLGAEVVRPVGPSGDPLAAEPHRTLAWHAHTRLVEVSGPEDPALADLLAGAAIVIDTPGSPGAWELDPSAAPEAVWVRVTPFGLDGPRAHWRASDLGVMAASAKMYCTGDPDRAPVRCTEPSGYAHTGPEAALAGLSALATGRPQLVDVAMQEAVLVANMAAPTQFPKTGFRGTRRGTNVGRTRELWPTEDGWVSFGLRGGKARVASLELIAELCAGEGVPGADALAGRDWASYSPAATSDEELRAIEAPIAEYFARHTMRELYELACETNLMLAPANSPREIYASEQLAARGFFVEHDGTEGFPRSFCLVHEGGTATPRPLPTGWRRPWEGVHIIELGSGAAGPIATRYFAEHGATVLRIESRSRPDFLRVYALGSRNPHGLEGAPMYDGLNVAKRNATFNLKRPEAVELVRRLVVEWADVVVENFAPRAMKSFGLDYDSLVASRPDLVMVSACLNGQTGPHKDYPGFGGQGSALSGYNWLTGWPDRAPVGPHGTITDSLAPRFAAVALAAALLHRTRSGQGAYIDVSQVEAALFSLSPWLLAYRLGGVIGTRSGNACTRAVLHEAFPCADEDGVDDRWVAIACWTAEELTQLRAIAGDDIAAWTRARSRLEVAETLQAVGIEAVPVQDFGDLHTDPQLAHRGHFVPLTHPVMGPGLYERNGFRLSDAEAGYERTGPTLGQDQDWVLHEVLGLSAAERATREADGVFE